MLIIAMLTATAWTLDAQRLSIGERVPELNISKWLTEAPSLDGKAVMVEFFHSSNQKSIDRLRTLDDLARKGGNKLAVVVVTKEDSPEVGAMLTEGAPAYSVGYDTGSTFPDFEARYVPYAVLYDRRGRILWVGNPTTMKNEDIIGMLK